MATYRTRTWSGWPPIQNLPRPRSPEGEALSKAMVDCLVAEAHAQGCDLFAMSTYPASQPTPARNWQVRQAVANVLHGSKRGHL